MPPTQNDNTTTGTVSKKFHDYKRSILATNDAVEVDAWIAKSLKQQAKHKNDACKAVLALDCEWCAPWWRTSPTEKETISTIQLYCPFVGALVYHCHHNRGTLPSELLRALEDPTVVLLGVNVQGDASRIIRDYTVRNGVSGLLDLAQFETAKSRKSLEGIVQQHCPPNLHICKREEVAGVRTSNWSVWPLNEGQTQYAASDVYLTMMGFLHQKLPMVSEVALTLPKAFTLLQKLGSDVLECVGVDAPAAAPSSANKRKATPLSENTPRKANVFAMLMKGAKTPQQTSSTTPLSGKSSPTSTPLPGKSPKTEIPAATPTPLKRAKTLPFDTPNTTDDAQGDNSTELKRSVSEPVPNSATKNNFFIMMRNKSLKPPNQGKKDIPSGTSEKLKGVVVIVSGVLDSMSRKEFETFVKGHGGRVSSSVTKKVNYLVNDHGEVGPSKLKKCKDYDIPIVGEDTILGLVRDAK